jgi:predicted nucleotidyltransferase
MAATSQLSENHFPVLWNNHLPVHRAAAILEPYLARIVDCVRPLKVIPFGSYAYGTPTADSDFDLLVIRKNISSSRQSNIEIRNAIADVPAPPASFTFLSHTPSSFEEKVGSGSFVFNEIASKGLVLYDAEEYQ